MFKEKRIFTMDIVLKVVERCNLACPHCYYYFHEFDGNDNQPIIGDDVVEALPDFLNRSVRETNIQNFNIVLHGGEPLMMKKEKFDYICTHIKKNVLDDVKIEFAIQANGVLIDDEWIEIFAKHNISVGLSLDGTEETHGKVRPKHNGKSSYNDAIKGLKLVQQAYRDGKLSKIGALSLLHPDDQERALKHLIEELGINSPGLNFPRGGWDTQESPTWNSHVESHKKAIQYWTQELVYPKFKYVRGISNVFMSMQSEDFAEYNDYKNALKHHIVTISSEGALLIDDNMFGLADEFSKSKLSIFQHSLKDHFDSDIFQELIDAVDHKPLACEGCDWYRLCGGGALYNRFSKLTRFKNKAIICDTLTMIYEELAKFSLEKDLIDIDQLENILKVNSKVNARGIYQQLTVKE
ncbi:radical SAM protein [Pseudoalteromonas sp. MMG012]|uniref:radical SAM protein n=1 Tax=Pseudoalteromonas sp. MMG012 TaxID=2822686 RepID=UPI001B3A0A8A|nr:radical SAM protein [Pseudoalteromonas sp. MMG012]MBQ4851219.1 radical SAM protein [Pseudoalteromonas sp. MMG012]